MHSPHLSLADISAQTLQLVSASDSEDDLQPNLGLVGKYHAKAQN